MLKIHLFYIFFLQIRKKAVPLYRVFHGIRFKVNGRLVVEMTTFFFCRYQSVLFVRNL